MRTTSLSELLSLPAAQRADLAIALWDSLADIERDQALPVGPELAAELDRRWAVHVADPGSAIPWSEVQRKLGG